MRRKLLLMSKAQNEMKLQFKQQIQSFYNQDLNDFSFSYNNNILNNTSDQLEMDNIINSINIFYLESLELFRFDYAIDINFAVFNYIW